MNDQSIFFTLLGMAIVTYLPRLLPAGLLRGRQTAWRP